MDEKSLSKWTIKSNNRFAVMGMSGLGKTFISIQLKKLKTWDHYSVDYEIGKILFTKENITYKKGFSTANLSNLSKFLGKPGNSSKGGITFSNYLSRQRKHRDAEVQATLNSCSALQKTKLENFICDTSGSISELVDPSDPNDRLLTTLSKNFLIVCLKADPNIYETLIQRFMAKPKPMYYEESFLKKLWARYIIETDQEPGKIDPDQFILYGYKALVQRREKIFDLISKNWGVSINFRDIKKLKSGPAFVDLVKAKVDEKLVKY
jgi:hypothetical protein